MELTEQEKNELKKEAGKWEDEIIHEYGYIQDKETKEVQDE